MWTLLISPTTYPQHESVSSWQKLNSYLHLCNSLWINCSYIRTTTLNLFNTWLVWSPNNIHFSSFLDVNFSVKIRSCGCLKLVVAILKHLAVQPTQLYAILQVTTQTKFLFNCHIFFWHSGPVFLNLYFSEEPVLDVDHWQGGLFRFPTNQFITVILYLFNISSSNHIIVQLASLFILLVR